MALSARHSILKSVFPSAPLTASAPTPQATPLVSQGSFADAPQISGSFHADDGEDAVAEKIHWERAWHTATAYLIEQLKPNSRPVSFKACPHDVQESIRYLRSPDSVGYQLRKLSQADDLIWWYSQVIQLLFLKQHMPILKRSCDQITDSATSWKQFLNALVPCKDSLLGVYQAILLPLTGRREHAASDPVREQYRSLVVESLSARLEPKLVALISSSSARLFGFLDNEDRQVMDSMEGVESGETTEAQKLLAETLSQLVEGGFSSALLERLLAKGLNDTMRTFVTTTYARRWDSPSSCVDEVKEWVARPFARLAARALDSIHVDSSDTSTRKISDTHISDWQQYAIEQLGLLRLKELFEIVVDWDSGSKGGIEDLRHYTTSAARRLYVINTFAGVLSYRLLIPGASTAEILQMYIRIIRAFALLDHRFVVLERVSRPIRRYLRDRDDTVRIIVRGLLADPVKDEPSPDALVELASELHQMNTISADEEDFELDWDDMTWMPNPADAEPDFKRSRNLDVIGNLISLFDNKEIFVREFQNILGERLLGASIEFDREIRVLELLKSRFGEGALQGCEVMLKDIKDSRRTDVLIKKEQKIDSRNHDQPEIYAKILSRFFWPSLRGEEFKIPGPVQELQDRYAHGFEEHKMQRKLAWLPALGQVTVELQLKYRTVKELVTTWQASVIYAFSSEDNSDGSPQKTEEQLVADLEMDEDLVANALVFWVSKLVLYQPTPGTYEVLEVLPTEEEAESVAGEQKASADIVAAAQTASAAAAASAASAVRSEEELAEEKMEVVWQYVVGMLTNQGSMPMQQMVMMLNFVVPGGFTHSNEEFRGFLQRCVDDGRLEMAGANYKIPKK